MYRLYPSFLLLCLTFWLTELSAQKISLPGYVVPAEGDRINGYIWLADVEEMSRSVGFSTDPLGKSGVDEFLVDDLKAYGFGKASRFERILVPVVDNSGIREAETEYRFGRLYESGRLDLFYIKEYSGDRYFLRKDGRLLSLDPYLVPAGFKRSNREMLLVNGQGQTTERFNVGNLEAGPVRSVNTGEAYLLRKDSLFRVVEEEVVQLNSLLGDCLEVQTITAAGLNKSLVRRSVRDYNRCRIAEQPAKTYKPRPRFQGAVLAGLEYNEISRAFSGRAIQYNLQLEIRQNDWTPNISFSYAIGYSRNPDSEVLVMGVSQPAVASVTSQDFSINYHPFPGRNVRPFFSLGLARYRLLRTAPIDSFSEIVYTNASGGYPLFAAGVDLYFLRFFQLRAYAEHHGGFGGGLRLGAWF